MPSAPCQIWQGVISGAIGLDTILIQEGFSPSDSPQLMERNFVFHEVAWEGDCQDQDCVYDACLEYDGDDAPGDAPIDYAVPCGVAFSDGSELSPFVYRERLSKNGSNGYGRCVNLNTRTRRVLK